MVVCKKFLSFTRKKKTFAVSSYHGKRSSQYIFQYIFYLFSAPPIAAVVYRSLLVPATHRVPCYFFSWLSSSPHFVKFMPKRGPQVCQPRSLFNATRTKQEHRSFLFYFISKLSLISRDFGFLVGVVQLSYKGFFQFGLADGRHLRWATTLLKFLFVGSKISQAYFTVTYFELTLSFKRITLLLQK